jgi:hypothetical protein
MPSDYLARKPRTNDGRTDDFFQKGCGDKGLAPLKRSDGKRKSSSAGYMECSLHERRLFNTTACSGTGFLLPSVLVSPKRF